MGFITYGWAGQEAGTPNGNETPLGFAESNQEEFSVLSSELESNKHTHGNLLSKRLRSRYRVLFQLSQENSHHSSESA